jgi:hypothetical protein
MLFSCEDFCFALGVRGSSEPLATLQHNAGRLKEFFQPNFSLANLSQPFLHERQINRNLSQRFLAMTSVLKPDLINRSDS